jgi:hypothetical protein
MRKGTFVKLWPVVRLTRSQYSTLPAGKFDDAKIAPYARTMTPVLDTSWLAAAGSVGETTVVVVLPHVTVRTKPVWVSADATPAPIISVALATAHAAATLMIAPLVEPSETGATPILATPRRRIKTKLEIPRARDILRLRGYLATLAQASAPWP